MKRDRWRQQRQSFNAYQEQELLRGQRRRLEAMLQRQNRQERLEVLEEVLAKPSLAAADFAELHDLLGQAGEAERRTLLERVCLHLGERFGQQELQPPLPPELPGLLRLLAAHAKGPSERERRESVRIEGLRVNGLDLVGLELRGIRLRDCAFNAAELPGLKLFAARLEATSFRAARLRQADFSGATLRDVDFGGADLSGAQLISAELVKCDLRGASLQGAGLRGMRLNECDLRGASLTQATGLSFNQLLGNLIDAQTQLPPELEPRRAELIARSTVTAG